MIKIARIVKDYQDSGALNACLNLHAATGDGVFLTKGGDLMSFLRVQGVDAECLDPRDLEHFVRVFAGALRLFDEKFRVYQYLLKRPSGPLPAGRYESPVVQAAINNRRDFLHQQGLAQIDIYWAIAYETAPTQRELGLTAALRQNPAATLRRLFSSKEAATVLENELDRAREVLANKINSFVIQLRDIVPLQVLGKYDAYRFLRRLVNYAPYKAESVELAYDEFIDFQMCDSLLECHRDHLRLDDYYVEVLTLKDPPAHTFAHLLRRLPDLPPGCIIASEWKRESNAAVRQVIQTKRRHFHNAKASLLNYVTADASAGPKDMLIDDGAAARRG